ncbi:DUF6777 domain-containing protein [Streptomyces sporangiiformans]|uniref:DUF6777 domain-containing protein n=1 Tax=Streptomyces sporangiiformans TaxID=2315329 RepID=A0A505DPF3_9ACTN|nr:DUF6777 domain-containing protein [Streptomyces sporangiiformans]TPQ23146.1 hypothetical protein FGD71_005485 [Streptomyces sporangiiformans]
MSTEPPPSDRPTGPPSGPLSGPSRPSSGPSSGDRGPSGPSGGGEGADGTGGGPPGPGGPSGPGGPTGPGEHGPGDGHSSGDGHGPGGGGGRPWWKSGPRVAVIAVLAIAAVTLGLLFTRPDGASNSGSEVFLQAAGKAGPDPYTQSTARDNSTVPQTPSPTGTSQSANVTHGVDGSAPGLYGGTREVASCDVERQISALQAAPAKNRAFASVPGIEPSTVPRYLRSLTPVQLRMDTRVTNHGYRDGAATSYQAVLQAGTAVLVDDRGVPRVRCACGNPLRPPVAQKGTPKRTGDSWPSYRPSDVVVVSPAAQVINIFVIYDPDSGAWIARRRGDTGGKDRKTDPPVKRPSPSVSSLPPSSPSTPSPETESPKTQSPKTESPPSEPAPVEPSDPTTESALANSPRSQP